MPRRIPPQTNETIARILREIGEYLAMQNVPWKPRAYEKAAETIEGYGEELKDTYNRGGRKALEEIPGIGKAIGEKIEELLLSGRLAYYEELKKKTPIKLNELRRIEGLGPKSARKLYEALGVTGLASLERAAKAGKIRNLEGFGEKSEENILKGIGFVRTGGGRMPLHMIMPKVRLLEERLKTIRSASYVTVAGSVRRRKETIGDIDILVVADKPSPIMDYFVRMPEVLKVNAHGPTKSSVHLSYGFDADLRVVPRGSYGAALNYFTGSKDHNVALRQRAIEKGLKLNEYGLWRVARGKETMVAGKNEEEVYAALGLSYIEPELREMTGEIEAARKGELPNLIGYGDLKGDLQTQTDWTDGAESIEAMARGAAARGLSYIAITDHTKSLTITGGLDEKRLLAQMGEIDRVNQKMKGKIRVLTGTECEIRADGSLDLPDRALAKLDVVGASVHARTKMGKKEQTERIIRAMENPHVDVLFHPTGRIVGKREPYECDMELIIDAAQRTGTVLEANGSERLDLKDEHIRMAVEAGVRIAIDSDAHAESQYENLEYGIAQARRGWAEKKDVVNAWPLEKMRMYLKR